MAGFTPVKSLDGASDPFEYYLLTDNEAAEMGEGFVQTSGRLTKVGATATPEFIALRTQAAETTSITPLPVVRVDDEREWECMSTATVAATLVGSKVTLSTAATGVTATTTSGVFLISGTDGATTTSRVRGYFKH